LKTPVSEEELETATLRNDDVSPLPLTTVKKIILVPPSVLAAISLEHLTDYDAIIKSACEALKEMVSKINDPNDRKGFLHFSFRLIQLLWLHSQLEKAQYHLKSKNGISKKYYSHSEETPIYGNGQGAGDSPSQWSQESALPCDLYENAVMGAQMSFRNGKIASKLPLTAFADDTNLLGNDDQHTMNINQEEVLAEDH
jgi:hypothetical protein